ncbi:MAG TPA: hypothetical protein VF746_17805 [Longimicrobium sp.]|jgi:hypothetical protein
MIFPAWLWIAMLAAADPCAAAGSFCDCMPPVSPRASLERMDAVFRGVVVDVSLRPDERDGPRWLPPTRVVVRVTGRWKGADADTVVVRTGMGGGDCGFHFEPGGEYLIYAYAAEGAELTTGICTRTRQIEHAAEDLRELREAYRPRGPSSAAPSRHGRAPLRR